MEFHGWQQYQKKEAGGIGILTLFPPSWDTISAIYSEVLKLVSKFPYRRRLVLYFVYRGTTVKLDLGDGKSRQSVPRYGRCPFFSNSKSFLTGEGSFACYSVADCFSVCFAVSCFEPGCLVLPNMLGFGFGFIRNEVVYIF